MFSLSAGRPAASAICFNSSPACKSPLLMDPAPSGIAILDRDTLTKILAAVPFRPSHRLHPVGFYWSADVHRLLRNINKDFRAVVSTEGYRQRLSNAQVGRVMLREALQQLSTSVALDATLLCAAR